MHVLEEGASGVQVGDIEQVKCNFSFFKKKKSLHQNWRFLHFYDALKFILNSRRMKEFQVQNTQGHGIYVQTQL